MEEELKMHVTCDGRAETGHLKEAETQQRHSSSFTSSLVSVWLLLGPLQLLQQRAQWWGEAGGGRLLNGPQQPEERFPLELPLLHSAHQLLQS